MLTVPDIQTSLYFACRLCERDFRVIVFQDFLFPFLYVIKKKLVLCWFIR